MKRHGFTLIDLAVVLVLLIVLLCIAIPMLREETRSARAVQSYTMMRGIHQSLIMYGQSNKGWYPGMNRKGVAVKPRVEDRFYMLLDGGFFAADYAISPVEVKTIWTTGEVSSENYSYAMADIDVSKGAGRANEWREMMNRMAPAISDRNTGNEEEGAKSLHGKDGEFGWEVAWNDNHVTMEKEHVLKTKFMKSRRYDERGMLVLEYYDENEADDLFVAAGEDDAWMIYEGQ
ncbi:hypothetical protein JD969_04680 [Planctomycetota bacterium]|nr:hypothetical protein JD969_04680 [Planctomycetota bacterium]